MEQRAITCKLATFYIMKAGLHIFVLEVMPMQTEAIWQILPDSIKAALLRGNVSLASFEEIRIRAQRPVSLRKGMSLWYLNQDGSLTLAKTRLSKTRLPKTRVSKTTSQVSQFILPSKAEMEQILLNASRFSVYAVEEQIRQGYLTIQGGHRIGICGEVILRNGQIQGIRRISSYNIRIVREVCGCAKAVYPWLWEKEQFLDTLIVSPPGLGKTTLLRDLIRLISDGDDIHIPLTVGLADERGEIAACINGIPQNDVGQNMDVMDGGSKTSTMPMLLRTMAPQVLAADEAGGVADIQIFEQAKKWGTSLLTTAHGTIKKHLFDQRCSQEAGAARLFLRYIEIQINDDHSRSYLLYDPNRTLMTTINVERSDS